MRTITVLKAIAERLHSLTSDNKEWRQKAHDCLDSLEDFLPSGSGVDSGTKIDRERSNVSRLVLTTAFHHMNENGYYDGWTDHTVTIVAELDGYDIRISGRDRNDIKDYLADLFRNALDTEIVSTHDRETGETEYVLASQVPTVVR